MANNRLGELAAIFLKLGLTAFGGPAAHIALMEQEIVTRREWMTHREFLDMLAATNFIPGPNSTEMAIHIGYGRAGAKGLVVAGACFILPSTLLCAIIAAIYVRFGQFRITEEILYGVKPVVIAIVAQALFRLGRSTLKSPLLAGVMVAAGLVNFFWQHELLVLFGSGAIVFLLRSFKRPQKLLPMLAPLPLGQTFPATSVAAVATTSTAAVVAASLLPLFLVFLKIGSVLFGSGYVLVAFLQADLVDRHHWLTQHQLLDAVAVGQITPGPVSTTATFIGYVLLGPMGALVATLGLFLPAFFFVAISAPFLPALRKSKRAAAFLDGLNAASIALMAVVMVQLCTAALVDWLTISIAVVSIALLLTFKNLNSAWLMVAGAAAATAFHFIHG